MFIDNTTIITGPGARLKHPHELSTDAEIHCTRGGVEYAKIGNLILLPQAYRISESFGEDKLGALLDDVLGIS